MKLRWIGLCVALSTILILAVRRAPEDRDAAEFDPGVTARRPAQLESELLGAPAPAEAEDQLASDRRLLIHGTAFLHKSNREREEVPEGTLRLSLEDAAGHSRAVVVAVRDSIWQAEVNEGEALLADSLEVSGRLARPLRRERFVDLGSELRLVFLWDGPILLNVLDELTREPLKEIALISDHPTDAQFGYPSVGSAPLAGDSPVQVPASRYSQTHWVGARGHAWTPVVLEPMSRERTILLPRGSDIDVLLVSAGSTSGAWVELRELEGERDPVWTVPDAREESEWNLRGLPWGRFVASAGRNSTPTSKAQRAPEVAVDGSRGGLAVARLQLDEAGGEWGRLVVEVLLPPKLTASTRVVVLVREARSDGTLDRASPPAHKHTQQVGDPRAGPALVSHAFDCVRPGVVQVEVEPFGCVQLTEVNTGEETRIQIDLSRPFSLDVSVSDAFTGKRLRGALVVCRSLDLPLPGEWFEPLRSRSDLFHFETTATRVEVCAWLASRGSVHRIVTLGPQPTDVELKLKRAQPIEVVLQLREGEEPVAVSSSTWTKLTGKRLDGDGEMSSFELKLASAPRERGERVEHSSSAVLATFSFPGTYKLELDGVPGFERCEVERELAASTGTVTLQLVRKQR